MKTPYRDSLLNALHVTNCVEIGSENFLSWSTAERSVSCKNWGKKEKKWKHLKLHRQNIFISPLCMCEKEKKSMR